MIMNIIFIETPNVPGTLISRLNAERKTGWCGMVRPDYAWKCPLHLV